MRNALIGLAALALTAGSAAADTFGFCLIEPSNGNGDISSQLSVEVLDAGMGNVTFRFENNVGTASSVSEIYIDDGNPTESLLSGFILSQNGTNFSYGSAAPGDLPGGNNVGFEVSVGFLADAQGNPSNGISTSTDHVTIQAELKMGVSFADLIARINSGETRFGLHIRAIGQNGGSDAYVSKGDDTPPPPPLVPAPMTAVMGAVGLGAVVSRRRR